MCVRVRAVSNIVFKGSCRTELLNLLDTFGDGNDLLMCFSLPSYKAVCLCREVLFSLSLFHVWMLFG